MSETIEEPYPKARWRRGPWHQEPDRLEFRYLGLPCLIQRAEIPGSWCGYAGIPPGHRLYGCTRNEANDMLPRIVQGLTYHGDLRRDGDWYFGFDHAHAGDVMPALASLVDAVSGAQGLPKRGSAYWMWHGRLHYWTVKETARNARTLARALWRMA